MSFKYQAKVTEIILKGTDHPADKKMMKGNEVKLLLGHIYFKVSRDRVCAICAICARSQ